MEERDRYLSTDEEIARKERELDELVRQEGKTGAEGRKIHDYQPLYIDTYRRNRSVSSIHSLQIRFNSAII